MYLRTSVWKEYQKIAAKWIRDPELLDFLCDDLLKSMEDYVDKLEWFHHYENIIVGLSGNPRTPKAKILQILKKIDIALLPVFIEKNCFREVITEIVCEYCYGMIEVVEKPIAPIDVSNETSLFGRMKKKKQHEQEQNALKSQARENIRRFFYKPIKQEITKNNFYLAGGNNSFIWQQLKSLYLLLGSKEDFGFTPEERNLFLRRCYYLAPFENEDTSLILKIIKKLSFDETSSIFARHSNLIKYQGIIQDYKQKKMQYGYLARTGDALLPYETSFSEIFEHMLHFENNITGGHALILNVHDKIVLNEVNILLKGLLENEASERKFLSAESQQQMLDDILMIFNNLPTYTRDRIAELDLVYQETYLQNSIERIRIMKNAQQADPTSVAGEQWYSTAKIDEISILDHEVEGKSRQKITQGRSLQLVYDAMIKEPNPMKYATTLAALINLLGSTHIMNACKEGSIGGIVRAVKPLYADDPEMVSEKFNNSNLLHRELDILKSFMISLLDGWRQNKRIFNTAIRPHLHPMIPVEFLEDLKTNHDVMHAFLKHVGEADWEKVLIHLESKSLYQLFEQSVQSEKEEENIEDLHRLLIVPAIKAFIYSKYKHFLVNNSLNLNDYVIDAEARQILSSKEKPSAYFGNAAIKIQSLIRGKLVRKHAQVEN